MTAHNFNFEGGEILTGIGATWFVSYAYYEKIDKNHRNQERVSTAQSRLSRYNKSKQYHKAWLQEVVAMNPANLNKNTIGLNASQTIAMAKELLAFLEKTSNPQPIKKTPVDFEEKVEAAFDSFGKSVDTFADNLGKKIDSIDDDDIEQFFIKIGKGVAAFFTVTIPKIYRKIKKLCESDTWGTIAPFLFIILALIIIAAIATGLRTWLF